MLGVDKHILDLIHLGGVGIFHGVFLTVHSALLQSGIALRVGQGGRRDAQSLPEGHVIGVFHGADL